MKRFWKRTLSLLLALVMTVGLVQGAIMHAGAAKAEAPAATGVAGDANGDGALSVKDLVRTLKAVEGTDTASTDVLFTNWQSAVKEDAETVADLLIQKDVFPAREATMIEDFECGRPAGLTLYEGTNASVKVEEKNHLLAGAAVEEAWLGFENANYSFASTKSLKVTIKQENPAVLPADSFNIMTTGWKVPDFATRIGDDYILTFSESFESLSSLIVKIDNGVGIVSMDNVMTCEPIGEKLADGMKGQAYTVALPTAEAEAGTVFAVSYRVKGAADWNPIEPVDGVYTFTPAEVATYQVRFEGTKNEKVVYAAIREFKTEDPDVIWDDLDNYSIVGAGVVKSELSGTPALAVNSGAGTWGYFENLNYNPGKPMDGIIVKMKSNNGTITASTVYLYYNSGEAAYASTIKSLGNDEYLFTFGTTINTVETFSFEVKAGDTIFISYVKAYYEIKDPNIIVDFEDGMPGVKYAGSNANETVVDDGTGNHVLRGQSTGTWMGFQGASINIGKSVTKLKITITQTGANPVNLTAGMFWLVTDTSGSLYPTSVEKNGNEYTLTFGTAFSVLKTFTVNITEAMGQVTFDNIMIVE